MTADDLKMVMDFADGSLDPAMEDALFLKLGADEELRQEFKTHMAVKNAVRTGVSAFVLSPASKTAVFSKLGLTVPSAVTSVSSGAVAGLTAFLSRKRFIATTGLLIFATALYFLLNFESDNIPGDLKANKNIFTTGTEQKSVPSISSIEGKRSTVAVHSKIAVSENIPMIANDIVTLESGTIENIPVNLINTSSIDKSEFRLSPGNSIKNNNLTAGYNSLDIELPANKIPLGIEFIGSSVRSTNQPTIGPAKLSGFNNLGLGLLYNISDNLQLGANMRQETFFLRYRGTEENEEFIYEQQPNFTTFGIQASYSLDSWNGFSPYAQVNAGINNIGLVGRASAGIHYSLLSNLSVVLGIEYGHMLYTHQNNYFNSSKFGLNYGLIYSF